MRIARIQFLVAAALTVMASSVARAHEGWGVVVDASGRVHVTDIPANTIWRISRDGQVEAIGRNIHSHALSLGSDGAVYGSNASLKRSSRKSAGTRIFLESHLGPTV